MGTIGSNLGGGASGINGPINMEGNNVVLERSESLIIEQVKKESSTKIAVAVKNWLIWSHTWVIILVINNKILVCGSNFMVVLVIILQTNLLIIIG